MTNSREYPERPFVAVGAIVFRGTGNDWQVLLGQRGKAPAYGRWTIPGGAVELGETVQEALIREVTEECNIEVEIGPLVGIVDRVVKDDYGRVRFHYVILDFAARYLRGDLRAGSDSIGARWAPLNEIERFGLHDFTVAVIRKAARMLEGTLPSEGKDKDNEPAVAHLCRNL